MPNHQVIIGIAAFCGSIVLFHLCWVGGLDNPGALVGVIGTSVTVAAVLTGYFFLDLRSKESAHRDAILRRVSGQDGFWSHYDPLLQGLNRWADQFFEKSKTPLATPPNPWSARSFDRWLTLSLIYPIGSAVLGWVLMGDAGEFGVTLGLTAGADWPERTIASLSLIGMGIGFWRSSVNAGARAMLWFVVAVAGTIAFVGTIAGTFAGAVSVAYAVAGAVGVAFAVAGAVAFAVAVAVAGVGVVGVGVAFAFAFAGAVAADILYKRLDDSNRPHRLWFVVAPVYGIGLTVLFVAARLGVFTAPGQNILILGIGLLPLLNMPFDFLSTGFTRFALRQHAGHRGPERVLWAVADVMVALLCLMLLCVALIIGLEVFNHLARLGGADTTLIPVAAQLDQLTAADGFEGRFFWLYFALFSTLLPSVIHLTIAIFSLYTWGLSTNAKWIERTLSRAPLQDAKVQLVALAIAGQWVQAGLIALSLVWVLWALFAGAVDLIGPGYLELMIEAQKWITQILA